MRPNHATNSSMKVLCIIHAIVQKCFMAFHPTEWHIGQGFFSFQPTPVSMQVGRTGEQDDFLFALPGVGPFITQLVQASAYMLNVTKGVIRFSSSFRSLPTQVCCCLCEGTKWGLHYGREGRGDIFFSFQSTLILVRSRSCVVPSTLYKLRLYFLRLLVPLHTAQARTLMAQWLGKRQRCEALEATARKALQHPLERQGGLGRGECGKEKGDKKRSLYGRTLAVPFEFLLKDLIGLERVAQISTPGGNLLKLLK